MALWTPINTATDLWLDAKDPGTITESAGDVITWADKSGNGYDAAQASSSIRPFYDEVKEGIAFQGLNDRLQGTHHGSFFSKDFFYSIAIDYESNGGNTGYMNLLQLLTGALSHNFWVYARTQNQALEVYTDYGSIGLNGSFPVGTPARYILGAELKNGILTIYKNGQGIVSGAFTDPQENTLQNFYLGQGTFSTSRSFIGLYHEVVLGNQEDRVRTEGYLAWKWGLQASLPAWHPYKNAAPTVDLVASGNLVQITQQVVDAADIIASGDLVTISQSVTLTASGGLSSIAQTVARFGSGNLTQIEQAVTLRLVGKGELVSVGQTINATTAAGNLTRIAQRVSDQTQQTARFDLELIVGDLTIPANQIHGTISISRSESSAALMDVTLIPPKGAQNITQYQGKNIILNYIEGGTSTRIYTGKVDIPEIDIMGQTITLRCTDNRTEQNNSLDPVFVQGIGQYSEAVFGEAKDQNDEIEKRLRTVQASLDYDANGLVTYTSWTPKATADFTLDNPDIFRRTPRIEVLSRGRVVNQINLDITYRWTRLRHRERSWTWRYPFNAATWCGFLLDNIGLCPVDAPRRAAEGAGWPIKPDSYETEPLPPSKWYRCTGNGVTNKSIGWQTSNRVCKTRQKLDDNDNPVTQNGEPVYETYDCRVTDSQNAFAIAADWSASKRWAQTVEQKVAYTITAPQSVNQYGLVERDERVGTESEYDASAWEDYNSHQKPPENATESPNGDWVIDRRSDGLGEFDAAFACARAKAVADILGSHRQNYVTLQLPMRPDIDLRHTIETTAGKIQCKGKAYSIRHTIDVGDKFAETEIQIALSRSLGNASDSLPAVSLSSVTDQPGSPETIRLSNWIGGRAPRTSLGFDFSGVEGFLSSSNTSGAGLPKTAQGFVTNYKYNRNRPLFTESFIVDTPAIEDAARDTIETETDQSATVTIRNDHLEVVFDE